MDPLGQNQAKKIINRIFIFDLVFFALTAIASLILGSVFSGRKGLWGAIIAVIVLLVFALFTPLAFKILSRKR
jgi:membrane protease YdiL (CAAX protease family)